MEVYTKKLVEERFLNMGIKFGWFDQPSLRGKIEKLIKLSQSNGDRDGIVTKTESVGLISDHGKEIEEEDNTSSVIMYSNDADDCSDYVNICDDAVGNTSNVNQESSTDSQLCEKMYFSENNDLMSGTLEHSFERDSSGFDMTEQCIQEGLENANGTASLEGFKVEDSCFYNNREEGNTENDANGKTNSNDDADDEFKYRNGSDDALDDDDNAERCDQLKDDYEDIIEAKSLMIVEEGCSSLLDNSLEVSDSCSRNLSRELIRSQSRDDCSYVSTENISLSDSPAKVSELSRLDETGSHCGSNEPCDNNSVHNGLSNTDVDDIEHNDDVDDKDVQCNNIEKRKTEMLNSVTDDEGQGALSIDLSRTTLRNGCSSFNNSSESNNRSYSPVEGVDHELSKLQESSSLNNTDSYSDSQEDNKDHTCLNKSNDDKCNDDDDRNLLDSEEMQVLAISSACDYDRKSDDDDDDDDFDGESMGTINCSIEETSPVKASLSERLLNKYNPEKSESDDVDDFEQFLQNIRTPKQSGLFAKERKPESSLNMFIVDDDDDDDYNDIIEAQDDDVFCDPGFTPEPGEFFDDDKENEDCIELATPVAGNAPSKTSLTSLSRKAATHSTPNRPTFQTPSTDFSWRTPKTKPRNDSGLLSAKPSRPKSVLENILTPFSAEKDFKKNKEKLVRDLFELYNRTVFDNQLPSDFQISWNSRMRSTAGFCYYSRKGSLRMARIELADKVIDSADRLRDTLIHELCHAAAWMISGVKAGHGPVWKRWTLRANHVHQDLPPISRCHSYTIKAKYTYRCTKCGNTFGRHSKSVNLEKSRCAYCHSRLELVPPLKKDGTPQNRTPSRFAMFVKENYARIKSGHETFSHQDVMKALSTEFSKLST